MDVLAGLRLKHVAALRAYGRRARSGERNDDYLDCSCHGAPALHRDRLDAQQRAVVLVGDDVQQAVRPLPHVANALMQRVEQSLAAELLELVVEHDALETTRARDLAAARA